MQERWLPVTETNGLYEVSSLGRVRRRIGGPGARAGRLLIGGVNPNGYPHVTIRIDGRKASRCRHRLVALAFIGPRPPGMEINHKDGDKQNASIENLEYVTAGENIAHAFASGLRVAGSPPHPKGSLNPAAKLTEADVRIIRASGETNVALARRFGVSDVAVSLIRRGKKWTHVKG